MMITNPEGHWLAQVMDTISDLTSIGECNGGDQRLHNNAAEDVLCAAHRLIQLTKLAVGDR
jgi:hypothetical protein